MHFAQRIREMMITKRTNKLFSVRIILRILILTLFISLNCVICIGHAASQGKLGKQSSASIDISVQINQTLTTVHPEELILNQTTLSNNRTFKPFCVAHHGYSQNASVPYELKVDDLKIPQQNLNTSQNKIITSPYNIYIEDKNSFNNRLRLSAGMSLFKQSVLSLSDQITKECENSGVHLAIELTDSLKSINQKPISPGLLILLVSPN